MSNEGVESRAGPGEEHASSVEELVASIGLGPETTSRRRSPDASINSSATTTRPQPDEPSVVLDLGTDSDVPSGSSRERSLASFMANFFPSIASSGSGVRTGASNVMSRALNNLANPDGSTSSRGNGPRRGPLQLRSIFSEWRSSNSDMSSDSDSEDVSSGRRRIRRFRSAQRSSSDATRPLLPNRSDASQSNAHSHSVNVAAPIDLSRLQHATQSNVVINGTSTVNIDDDPPDVAEAGETEAAGDAGDGATAGADANSPRSILRTLLPLMSKGIPFLLLVIVKVLWEHSLGILVMLGLSLTFWHANKMLKNQVSLKERRSLVVLAWIVVFLSSDVYLIFLVFQKQELGNALILSDTIIEENTFGLWHLLWVVGITDFIIRFSAITLKSFVLALPRKWLPYKFRGKYYLLIETLSNLYRQLTTIRPWLRYLWGDESENQILGGILVVLYSALKLNSLRIALGEGFVSLKAVRRDTSYGTLPSAKALKDACAETGGDEKGGCPICQEEFKEPIELSCKHIFCEECVSMWFDRERTCPLCRATIADDPKWRDGSTSYALQLY